MRERERSRKIPLSETGTFVGGAGWGGSRVGVQFGTCYFCNVKEQLDLEVRGSRRRSLEREGYIWKFVTISMILRPGDWLR